VHDAAAECDGGAKDHRSKAILYSEYLIDERCGVISRQNIKKFFERA
jgi:hypothetical protein